MYNCRYCNRTFNENGIVRHEPICSKTIDKKRKPFNSRNQRLKNLVDGSKEFTAEFSKNQSPTTKSKPKNDYEQCPHCQRNFSYMAAERHIEFCKNQKMNQHRSTDRIGKNRLISRINFKPPDPCNKTKRVIASPNYISPYNARQLMSHESTTTPNNQLRQNTSTLRPKCNSQLYDSYTLPKISYNLKNDSRVVGKNKKYPSNDSHGGSSGICVGDINSSEQSSIESYQNDQKKLTKSKYCHTCGIFYPIDTARYCCECGTKRLLFQSRFHKIVN
ncbi:Zinc finger C2HC domain-containing protein 1A [Intoshia linei]|uniref:Zinc finger C2HC domain-containing protein 1A n=1 Tax=Intoshia linei TaxID=1819745 RepID=A0A177AX15_9BILA|nr:Zinc finger C2HC domain-containing protein 1A [Intoshia linei]